MIAPADAGAFLFEESLYFRSPDLLPADAMRNMFFVCVFGLLRLLTKIRKVFEE